MSDCLTATHGAAHVRQRQSALDRTSQQDKKQRLYSLYAKVWRADVLWAAWRHVKANTGAPGVAGRALETMRNPGQAEEMSTTLQKALREPRHQCAPVRVVAIPKPKGGTSPLGSATVEDRVVQKAMRLVVEPILAADFHDGSYGARPTRDAQQASIAMREDLSHRAWGVVAVDGTSSCTSIPHRKLMTLITQRSADGSLLTLLTQTLQVGGQETGQVGPTKGGGPQGAPLAPLDSTISLHLLDQLWHKRGSPEKWGATLHRDAEEAMLVCHTSPPPALAAWEAIATRMDLTRTRDKTHVTRVTDGCDCLGVNFVQRRSPRSGKNARDICPAKAAQQQMRNRLQSITSRRAPLSPQACVERVNPIVTGGANDVRHPNASHAVRGLQRFVTLRFRRYVRQRSQGRGFGWTRCPHSTLSAMGLASIGSGLRTSRAKPAHGVRCRLSDRRTREN